MAVLLSQTHCPNAVHPVTLSLSTKVLGQLVQTRAEEQLPHVEEHCAQAETLLFQ